MQVQIQVHLKNIIQRKVLLSNLIKLWDQCDQKDFSSMLRCAVDECRGDLSDILPPLVAQTGLLRRFKRNSHLADTDVSVKETHITRHMSCVLQTTRKRLRS